MRAFGVNAEAKSEIVSIRLGLLHHRRLMKLVMISMSCYNGRDRCDSSQKGREEAGKILCGVNQQMKIAAELKFQEILRPISSQAKSQLARIKLPPPVLRSLVKAKYA